MSFTSRYWDTNQAAVWRKHGEDMRQSSVWWGCTFAQENSTAQDAEREDMSDPARPRDVPPVSWWQVGKDVLAMSEWPSGDRIDVHAVKRLEGFQYQDEDWTEGWRTTTSPAHEQYEQDGTVWSSTAMQMQAASKYLVRMINSRPCKINYAY